MTIEIRQLLIRAVVEARPAAPAPLTLPSGAPTPTAPPPAQPAPAPDHDALVAACVREVLRELRRASER
ncbi:MAG: hypothetical protein IPK80_03810 [Nannocystis sp.]|jgi:hypothetical protein|nr:hypothetical protein [Nannocystis sp.]